MNRIVSILPLLMLISKCLAKHSVQAEHQADQIEDYEL